MTTGQILFAFAVIATLLIGTADHFIRTAYRRRRARAVNAASLLDFTMAPSVLRERVR